MKNWFEKSRLGWLLMAVGIIAACAPKEKPRELTLDRKSTRLNSSHKTESRMPSSA